LNPQDLKAKGFSESGKMFSKPLDVIFVRNMPLEILELSSA